MIVCLDNDYDAIRNQITRRKVSVAIIASSSCQQQEQQLCAWSKELSPVVASVAFARVLVVSIDAFADFVAVLLVTFVDIFKTSAASKTTNGCSFHVISKLCASWGVAALR